MESHYKPLVSILINNYNYAEFLKESIDSALGQTYSPLEVIVVDDGSTDNSQDIIASYANKIVPIYQQNKGQASAFNRGFAASKGEIICFLDADDIFHRQKVATVVKNLQDNIGCEWCFHPLELFTEEIESDLVREEVLYKQYQLALRDRLHQSSFKITPEQIKQQDLRSTISAGKLGNPFNFPIPATSGMCFTRQLASKLLPMPIADGIVLNDSYLKFAALGISRGITIEQKLAYQRIHHRNLFTTVDRSSQSLQKKRQNTAAIFISTAYWLKTNFPNLIEYANNIFAVGLALHWRVKSQDRISQTVATKYFQTSKLNSMILIFLKSCYKYLRAL